MKEIGNEERDKHKNIRYASVDGLAIHLTEPVRLLPAWHRLEECSKKKGMLWVATIGLLSDWMVLSVAVGFGNSKNIYVDIQWEVEDAALTRQ